MSNPLPSQEDELVNKIKSFLGTSRPCAMNWSVELDNGIVILLEHWKSTDDKLKIAVYVPTYSNDKELDLSSLSEMDEYFESFVNDLNKLLDQFGLNHPHSYEYVKNHNEKHRKRIKFMAEIKNKNSKNQ